MPSWIVWDYASQRIRGFVKSSQLALALLIGGCAADTPANALRPPDASKVIVIVPIDGEVRGRGSPGSLVPGTTHVFIAAHPSDARDVVPAAADGSFEFAIGAGSSDVLEFASIRSDDPNARGAPAFIQVPPTRVFADDYRCCSDGTGDQGTCVRVSEPKPVCDGSNPLLLCRSDIECAKHAGRTIHFPVDSLELSAPNCEDKDKDTNTGLCRSSHVIVTSKPGKLPALALVQMENRGHSVAGGEDPRSGAIAITNERGVFNMRFDAGGDDELVFQVYEFDGTRSRRHSQTVPDAQFAGVDLVGVFPFEQLFPGAVGTVAIRFSPYGVDGKGICPDTTGAFQLCFTGGLDHSMVDIELISLDSTVVTSSVVRTSTSATVPYVRATDGDVLGGPQVLALLIDTSAGAQTTDPQGARFDAAIDVINALRARDRLGIVSFGGTTTRANTEALPTNDKDQLVLKIQELEARATGGSGPDIYQAIRLATEMLRTTDGVKKGRLMIITASAPIGNRDEADLALLSVVPNPSALFDGFPTFVVGVGLDDPDAASALEDIAVFSGGEYAAVTSPSALVTASARITGVVSGAFVLLYDIFIPDPVGKAARVNIRATVNLPGPEQSVQTKTAEFVGTLEVSGAP